MSQNPWARPQQPDDEQTYWQYEPQQGQAPNPGSPQAAPGGQPGPHAQQPQGQPYPQQQYGQPATGWTGQSSAPVGGTQPSWQSAPPPVGAPAQPYVVAQPVRQQRSASALGQTPVTWAIIGICVLVWIGELLSPTFFNDVALTPYQGRSEPWRFITSAFAHSLTVTHIGFNMYALWTLRMLEPYLGRARFAATYLLCALAGGAAVVLLSSPHHMMWYTQVVGASGAIFGLFGALIFALRDLRAPTNQLWVVIGINLAISFTVPNIAWQAHVGGFLVGMLAGWLLVRERRHRLDHTAPDRSWMWLGILLAVVVAAVVLKYVASPAIAFQ